MARAVFLGLFPDLTSYYFGPQHVLMGENPYREDTKYFTPLVYPPLVMVLFTPLAIIPYELAGKVWVLLSIMTLVLSLYLLSKLEEVRFFSLKNLFICSLVFIAFPVRFTLGMGQINHLILFLFVLSLYFLQRNKKNTFRHYPLVVSYDKIFPGSFSLFSVLEKRVENTVSDTRQYRNTFCYNCDFPQPSSCLSLFYGSFTDTVVVMEVRLLQPVTIRCHSTKRY